MSILASGEGPHLTLNEEDCAGEAAYVEAVGERMALFGTEELECWMWPLQLFDRLRVELWREGAPREMGARRVEVVPEGLILAWPAVGLTLDIFACREERGLVLLVSLEEQPEAEVVLRLHPRLRPMWPAGLGGVISGRDPSCGAFLLTEELGRFAALIGAPEALELPRDADRGLAEELSLRLPLSPARAAKGPMPVVIAGAQRRPRPLSDSERAGGNQAVAGRARCDAVSDDARALYRRLLRSWPEELELQRAHWRDYLARTAHLEVEGDPALERAFLWSKIAIERCWVRVDGIGRGLVAGLGPSRGGERPGFGWFFNGDALCASRALAWLGDYAGCRDIFRFAAATQRTDGKLTHEITLAAELCDWYGDYPYAYAKGQQTPGFLSCLAHYVEISGDLELANELWPAVERAVSWCAQQMDAEGGIEVPRAGIAAVEAGPLAGRIRTEAYLQGICLSGLEGALALAQRRGIARPDWEALIERARSGLEALRRPGDGRLCFARLDDGSLFEELAAYTGLPLARHLSDDPLHQNRPEVMSDWGARMFATSWSHYDPEQYNTGSVFPYLTGFNVLALFRAGHCDAAWQVLRGQVELDGFAGPGYLPEFLPGDRAELLPASVPHQIFSQSALLQGVLVGLCGLRAVGSGEQAGLACRAYLPPGVDRIALRGVACGERRVDLVWNRSREGEQTTWRLRATLRAGQPLALDASLWVPPLCTGTAPTSKGGYPGLPLGTGQLERSLEWELRLISGPELMLPFNVRRGEASRNPRLVARRVEAQRVLLTLAGPAGSRWHSIAFPPGRDFTETTVELKPLDS